MLRNIGWWSTHRAGYLREGVQAFSSGNMGGVWVDPFRMVDTGLLRDERWRRGIRGTCRPDLFVNGLKVNNFHRLTPRSEFLSAK